MKLQAWNRALAAFFFALYGNVNAQVWVEYPTPPATTSELVAEVAAVIRGRVEAIDVPQADSARPKSQMTAYGVRVLEVLKQDGSVAVGEVVDVYRRGYVKNGQRVRESDFADFSRGEELILFLRWDANVNGYMPAYGPSGAYRVVDGVVEPYSLSNYALNQRRKTVSAFASEIKK